MNGTPVKAQCICIWLCRFNFTQRLSGKYRNSILSCKSDSLIIDGDVWEYKRSQNITFHRVNNNIWLCSHTYRHRNPMKIRLVSLVSKRTVLYTFIFYFFYTHRCWPLLILLISLLERHNLIWSKRFHVKRNQIMVNILLDCANFWKAGDFIFSNSICFCECQFAWGKFLV